MLQIRDSKPQTVWFNKKRLGVIYNNDVSMLKQVKTMLEYNMSFNCAPDKEGLLQGLNVYINNEPCAHVKTVGSCITITIGNVPVATMGTDKYTNPRLTASWIKETCVNHLMSQLKQTPPPIKRAFYTFTFKEVKKMSNGWYDVENDEPVNANDVAYEVLLFT